MTPPLLQRFRAHLQETGLLPAGSRVLLALSGGADSMALLHLVCAVADDLSLTVEAAHLDHALRDESHEDAEFTRAVCAESGVPLTVERIDVAAVARAKKGGLEETARQLRRDFLQRVARARQLDLILLAHHLDDQAETVLMRLLRGAGPAGLSAMRPVSPPFLRLLLSFPRQDLVDCLRGQGLAWREDPTNRNPKFLRNRIRHELMPDLLSYNPQLPERLGALAQILAQEEDYWELVTEQAFAALVCEAQSGECRLDCDRLNAHHPALAARLIRRALAEVRGDLRQIEAVHVDAVLALARSESPQGELALPGAWAGRRYQQLWLRLTAPDRPGSVRLELSAPGEMVLPDGRILTLAYAERPGHETTEVAEFDAAAVSWPLIVRSPVPGDRLRPSGMTGRKKLQDLFVDAKLTREERASQLLVASADEILWVVGLRRSDLFRPMPNGKILRLSITT